MGRVVGPELALGGVVGPELALGGVVEPELALSQSLVAWCHHTDTCHPADVTCGAGAPRAFAGRSAFSKEERWRHSSWSPATQARSSAASYRAWWRRAAGYGCSAGTCTTRRMASST